MSEKITAKVYVAGNDIDTDQIIPAQYLNLLPNKPDELEKLGSLALCGLPEGNIPFVKEGEVKSEYQIIIAGKNFGCGSSREHAPISLNAAGVKAVIAESYSRIFFRNSVNGGFLYPYETPDKIVSQFTTGDEVELDIDTNVLVNKTKNKTYQLSSLGDAETIIKTGGIFAYAKEYGTD